MFTKILASICRICPCCIAVRAFPESGFAKFMKKIEGHCPFCIAYMKTKKKD